jgi:hypothetical protein
MTLRMVGLLSTFALFLAFAVANATTLVAQNDKKPDAKEQTLSLDTGYLPEGIDGVHRITIRATLDAKGSGKGSMEFDPNHYGGYTEFGDITGGFTEIATQKKEITLKQVKADEGGRRLYEIQGERFSLVVGAKPTGNRLLWKDKDGKTVRRVLPLQ